MTNSPEVSAEYDEIERLVYLAISATQRGNRADLISAYEGLAPLETGDVIAELTLWVEDLTDGVEVEELLQAVVLPIPPNSEKIIESVLIQDIFGLQEAVGSDTLGSVLAALLVTVAALKDGRERLLALD
jgi:hypothetical protein